MPCPYDVHSAGGFIPAAEVARPGFQGHAPLGLTNRSLLDSSQRLPGARLHRQSYETPRSRPLLASNLTEHAQEIATQYLADVIRLIAALLQFGG